MQKGECSCCGLALPASIDSTLSTSSLQNAWYCTYRCCRRRYLKLRRGIPQSPWFLQEGGGGGGGGGGGDGGQQQQQEQQRKGEGSVQEAIELALLPAFRADSYTLITAGAHHPHSLQQQRMHVCMHGIAHLQCCCLLLRCLSPPTTTHTTPIRAGWRGQAPLA